MLLLVLLVVPVQEMMGQQTKKEKKEKKQNRTGTEKKYPKSTHKQTNFLRDFSLKN